MYMISKISDWNVIKLRPALDFINEITFDDLDNLLLQKKENLKQSKNFNINFDNNINKEWKDLDVNNQMSNQVDKIQVNNVLDIEQQNDNQVNNNQSENIINSWVNNWWENYNNLENSNAVFAYWKTIDIDSMLENLDANTIWAQPKNINQNSFVEDAWKNIESLPTKSNNKKNLVRFIIIFILLILGFAFWFFYIKTTNPLLFDNSNENKQEDKIQTPLTDKIISNQEQKNINTGSSFSWNNNIITWNVSNDESVESWTWNYNNSGEVFEDNNSKETDLSNQLEANKVVLESLKWDTESLISWFIELKEQKLLKQSIIIDKKIKEMLVSLNTWSDIDIEVLNKSVNDLQAFVDRLKDKLKKLQEK